MHFWDDNLRSLSFDINIVLFRLYILSGNGFSTDLTRRYFLSMVYLEEWKERIQNYK